MRRMITLLTALCLALTLTTPCLAAGAGMDNFRKAGTYSGQFADVPDSHWGLSAVKTCYEYGLMKGASDTAFLPGGTLTRAEAVVMASRLHQIYHTGQSTLTNGDPWYQPYVDYAAENGILAAGAFSDYTAPATRAEMARILYYALPEGELEPIKTVQFVSGVAQDAPYAQEIYTLYQAGVLTGSDQYGAFQPDDPITRVEAAAILARMALPQERRADVLMMPLTWFNSILSFLAVDMPQGTAAVDNATVYYEPQAGEYLLLGVGAFQNETHPGGTIYDYFPTQDELLAYLGGYLTAPGTNQVCTSVSYGDTGAYRVVMDVEGSKLAVVTFVHGDYLVMLSVEALMDDLSLFNRVLNSIQIDGEQAAPLL